MSAYKFSPNLASPEERRETFVAREAVLEDLLDRVRKIESGARHCILIGPRGMGKTHLLLLLADSIEADETLASQWMGTRFAEEEYSITSLAELLLKIVESLPNGKSKAKNIGRDADLALGHILDFCATSGKRLLLLMDNIQLYFNQFPDADIGRLRDILMNNSTFLVVGAAPSYFKQMTGYEESFYNFFEPIHLNELSPDEAEDMLRRRAEFENAQEFLERFDACQPKIRAVARLTGGNPRLILMLYQVMCKSDVMEAAEAFKRLLDELTPYFQGRMDGLPPQGRKVLDTLASMESPSTPTELAEAVGMPVNAVTSQLKRLRDGGFVQQAEKLRRSKITRYEVTERLFRMWREMRTETGRTKLGFLIRFLNLWYTPAQLLDETGKLLTRLAEAQRQERPRLLSHLEYLRAAAPELLRSDMESVYSHAEADRLERAIAEIVPLKELAECEEMVGANPDDAMAWGSRGAALGQLGRHQEALENFNKAVELEPKLTPARIGRGLMLVNLGRYGEAWEDFNKVVQLEPDEAGMSKLVDAMIPPLKELADYEKRLKADPDDASVWGNRGAMLIIMGRHEEALESCDRAIKIQPEDADVWYNRGVVLGNLGRDEEAVESYDRAIKIQPDLANAWGNRGVALGRLGRHEEELESCDRVIQIQPDDADAWYNRGVALSKQGRDEEELESYDRAIQIQPDRADAWYNSGLALGNLGRYEEELESYDRAIQIQPDDADTWVNRGWALINLRRYEEAVESCDRVIQVQPDDAIAWNNRGLALFNLGRHGEAVESLKKAVELAKAQNLGNISQFAALLAAETELLASLGSIAEDNPGSARRALKNAIENGKQTHADDFELAIFGYLKNVLKSGKIQFAQEAVEIIGSELGEEYEELLRPFSIALEYMQTKDVRILERLQQEMRELVLEIAEQSEN